MLASLVNWIRGDEAGISVPPMDGVLKPNTRLDQAQRVLNLPAIDNLTAAGAAAYCSSGCDLYRLSVEGAAIRAEQIDSLPNVITFLATEPAGRLAIGVAAEGIRLVSGDGRSMGVALSPDLAACAVAGVFTRAGALLVCVGSRAFSAADWRHDLMHHGRTGCILSIDPSGKVTTRVDNLAYPYGIAELGDGELIYSESWRHRVMTSGGDATRYAGLLTDLPAYPARIARSADGGFWLAAFAPRRQLFEMVLREDDYRREMMATIDPSDWICPNLSNEGRPDQPLQAGSVRQMGLIKPWAPSHSYGLVIKCDGSGRLVESWHSRADGVLHGITSVTEFAGRVLATSRGSGNLLNLGAVPSGGQL